MERSCLPGDTCTSFELDSLQIDSHNETLMRMENRSAEVQNLQRISDNTEFLEYRVAENTDFENMDNISRLEEPESFKSENTPLLSKQLKSFYEKSSFDIDLDDEISLADSRQSLSPENEISENIRNLASKGKNFVVFISENSNSSLEYDLNRVLHRIDKVGKEQNNGRPSSLRLNSLPSNLSMMSSASGITLVERPSNSPLS
ncbi:hypothetical protein HK096_008072, partial [Nowakowskiella sp. JEL0078]